MNRQTWLSERRTQAERWYTANAPTYDEREPSSPIHAAFLARVIASVDVDGTVLDAPCGTGRYMDAILGAGRRVVGIDQSGGMLEQARLSHPDVPVEQIGLQELDFRDAFDAAICIDALEYVPPEDWLAVLGNLRRAVRPGGLLYLTVEEVDRKEVDRAYADAVAAGLPVVLGEHHRRGSGYHFYPTRDQVTAWVATAGLNVVAEDTSPGSNYAYWHLLVRRSSGEIGGYDDDSVAAAWADHRHELTAFLVRSTRDHELADDILQDAYLHLIRKVRAGRRPSSVRAWLYRVAGNLRRSWGGNIPPSRDLSPRGQRAVTRPRHPGGIARRREVNVTPRIARGLGAMAMAAALLACCSGAQPPASSTGGLPTGTPGATLAPSMPPTLAPTIRPTATPTPEPTSAPEISVAWTRHYGTAADEGASAIAVDDGGISVVGTTSGTYETPLPGGSDGFIQRYDFAGEVQWTRQFGTPGQDWAKDVAADASGLTVLWVSDGSFESRDNARDLFLRRYDRSGTELWTTSYVTPKDEEAGGIAADATGLTVVGTTMGAGGDLTTASTPEPIEAIVLRYDLDGQLLWTRQFGSPEPAEGDEEGYRHGVKANAVAIDTAGFTIGGSTGGDLAAPHAGPSRIADAFIRRYDPDGNALWTRQWGQEGSDHVLSIAVDETGITAVGQTTNSAYEEDMLPTQAFIRRYDLAGELLWSEIFGSPDEDVAHGVTADAAGLTVTGHTYGSLDGPNEGTFDVFVRRYDRAGKVIWATQFGTSGVDLGMDVAAEVASFTIVGHTNGPLGGPGKGGLDLFVRRYSR